MRNILRKIKNFFISEKVTREELDVILIGIGAKRESLESIWLPLITKYSTHRNFHKEIQTLDERIQMIIEYLGIEQKREVEKIYFVKKEATTAGE